MLLTLSTAIRVESVICSNTNVHDETLVFTCYILIILIILCTKAYPLSKIIQKKFIDIL